MSDTPELGLTDADRERLADLLTDNRDHGRGDPEEDRSADKNPGFEAALPCGCGPAINNIMDTASDLDYECPACGRTFTRDEVAAEQV